MAAGGKGKKKPAALGKGAKFILSQCAAPAAPAASGDENHPDAASAAGAAVDFEAAKGAAEALLAPQRAGGVVGELRCAFPPPSACPRPTLPQRMQRGGMPNVARFTGTVDPANPVRTASRAASFVRSCAVLMLQGFTCRGMHERRGSCCVLRAVIQTHTTLVEHCRM